MYWECKRGERSRKKMRGRKEEYKIMSIKREWVTECQGHGEGGMDRGKR